MVWLEISGRGGKKRICIRFNVCYKMIGVVLYEDEGIVRWGVGR